MNREKNLLKNTAIISLGTFFPKFFTVLITPILTAQLTKAEYGEYDLIVTIVSLLLPIATLQISSAAFRFLINKRGVYDECKPIVSTIYFFVTITAICSGIIYYIVVGHISGISGIIVSIYFVFDILLITTQQVLRGLGKNMLYSVSTIIQSIVLLIAVVFLTGLLGSVNFGLAGVVVSLMLSTAVPFFLILFISGIIAFIDVKSVSKKTLKDMLSYSWPMVPNNLSIWVLNLSDRLVITAVLGIEANAIYAVANKLPAIFSSFQNTFTMAWQENASVASKDHDAAAYYSEVFRAFYGLVISFTYGLVAAAPVLFALLIRGDYGAAYAQIPILALGAFFNCLCSYQGGIYVAHKKTASVGMTTIAAAAINLAVDVALVRQIGIYAGSVSTLISFLALFLFRMHDMKKFQRIDYDYMTMLGGILLLAVMCVLAYRRNAILNVLNMALAAAGCVAFSGKLLKRMAMKILSKGKKKV